MVKSTEIRSYPVIQELSKALADYVAELSREAVSVRNRFTVGLSGGSLPRILAAELKNRQDIDWDKWIVFFCDERLVSLASEDSNYKLAKEELFDHVPIPEANIYTVDESLIANAEEAANDYQDKLISVFAAMNTAKFPVFDLLLLGMGPDGHTCSLFPDEKYAEVLNEPVAWVTFVEDSPKPPPRRITFPLTVLNHAHNVAFVVTGEGKKNVLHKVIDLHDTTYPAALVKPVNGKLIWFLDDAASASLDGLKK